MSSTRGNPRMLPFFQRDCLKGLRSGHLINRCSGVSSLKSHIRHAGSVTSERRNWWRLKLAWPVRSWIVLQASSLESVCIKLLGRGPTQGRAILDCLQESRLPALNVVLRVERESARSFTKGRETLILPYLFTVCLRNRAAGVSQLRQSSRNVNQSFLKSRLLLFLTYYSTRWLNFNVIVLRWQTKPNSNGAWERWG